DWKDVKLSLVSGRPISFVMDLYQPVYTTRPVVQPELYTSIRPQVYGEAMERLGEVAAADQARTAGASYGRISLGSGLGGGIGGGGGGGIVPQTNLQLGLARAMRVAPGALAEIDGKAKDRQLFEFESVSAAAQGAQAGESFQYLIKIPVSLARQKS